MRDCPECRVSAVRGVVHHLWTCSRRRVPNEPSQGLCLSMFDFHIDVNREFFRQEGEHRGEHGGLLTNAELEFMWICFSESRTPEYTVALILAYRIAEEVTV